VLKYLAPYVNRVTAIRDSRIIGFDDSSVIHHVAWQIHTGTDSKVFVFAK
jgi:hypothetical protein